MTSKYTTPVVDRKEKYLSIKEQKTTSCVPSSSVKPVWGNASNVWKNAAEVAIALQELPAGVGQGRPGQHKAAKHTKDHGLPESLSLQDEGFCLEHLHSRLLRWKELEAREGFLPSAPAPLSHPQPQPTTASSSSSSSSGHEWPNPTTLLLSAVRPGWQGIDPYYASSGGFQEQGRAHTLQWLGTLTRHLEACVKGGSSTTPPSAAHTSPPLCTPEATRTLQAALTYMGMAEEGVQGSRTSEEECDSSSDGGEYSSQGTPSSSGSISGSSGGGGDEGGPWVEGYEGVSVATTEPEGHTATTADTSSAPAIPPLLLPQPGGASAWSPLPSVPLALLLTATRGAMARVKRQTATRTMHRSTVLDWLFGVSCRALCWDESLHRAVHWLDRVLSKGVLLGLGEPGPEGPWGQGAGEDTRPPSLQLLGLTCLWSAGKYEEVDAWEGRDAAGYALDPGPGAGVGREDREEGITELVHTLKEMEGRVGNVLGWSLGGPTARVWLDGYLCACKYVVYPVCPGQGGEVARVGKKGEGQQQQAPFNSPAPFLRAASHAPPPLALVSEVKTGPPAPTPAPPSTLATHKGKSLHPRALGKVGRVLFSQQEKGAVRVKYTHSLQAHHHHHDEDDDEGEDEEEAGEGGGTGGRWSAVGPGGKHTLLFEPRPVLSGTVATGHNSSSGSGLTAVQQAQAQAGRKRERRESEEGETQAALPVQPPAALPPSLLAPMSTLARYYADCSLFDLELRGSVPPATLAAACLYAARMHTFAPYACPSSACLLWPAELVEVTGGLRAVELAPLAARLDALGRAACAGYTGQGAGRGGKGGGGATSSRSARSLPDSHATASTSTSTSTSSTSEHAAAATACFYGVDKGARFLLTGCAVKWRERLQALPEGIGHAVLKGSLPLPQPCACVQGQ